MSSASKPQNSFSSMPIVGTPKTPRASAASVASRRRCLTASPAGSARGASARDERGQALRILGVGAAAPDVAQHRLADEAARRRPRRGAHASRSSASGLNGCVPACRSRCRGGARASGPGGRSRRASARSRPGPCGEGLQQRGEDDRPVADAVREPTNASGSRSNARYANGETGIEPEVDLRHGAATRPAEAGRFARDRARHDARAGASRPRAWRRRRGCPRRRSRRWCAGSRRTSRSPRRSCTRSCRGSGSRTLGARSFLCSRELGGARHHHRQHAVRAAADRDAEEPAVDAPPRRAAAGEVRQDAGEQRADRGGDQRVDVPAALVAVARRSPGRAPRRRSRPSRSGSSRPG